MEAALRRRSAPEARTATVNLGPIDLWRHEVRRDGHFVPLTPTEFKLLHVLAINVGKVMLHSDLLTRVWGPEYRDDVDYLRTYVRNLRRKLEPNPRTPQFLVTKPGVGYMLAAPEDASPDTYPE